MTDEEIALGKNLFIKCNTIYGLHPEYKKLNKTMTRYEQFVNEMSEKYGCCKEKIKAEIHSYH